MKLRLNYILILFFLQLVYAEARVNIQKYAFNDPTKPYGYKQSEQSLEPQKTSLSLAMTFISSNGNSAVINGVSYSVGEVISGYRLKEIAPNKVTLVSLATGEQVILTAKRNLVLE